MKKETRNQNNSLLNNNFKNGMKQGTNKRKILKKKELRQKKAPILQGSEKKKLKN